MSRKKKPMMRRRRRQLRRFACPKSRHWRCRPRAELLEQRLLLNADAADTSDVDLILPGPDPAVLAINPITGEPYALTGDGITLGIWNGGDVWSSHVEFADLSNPGETRVFQADGDREGRGISSHATEVAGTMIAGGSDPALRGMAPEAHLWSFDWYDVATELARNADSLAASNHSYGTAIGLAPKTDSTGAIIPHQWNWLGDSNAFEDARAGKYAGAAVDFDQIAFAHPYHSIVTVAGDHRLGGSQAIQIGDTIDGWDAGPVTYDGTQVYAQDAYDTLVGSVAAAKNVIVVGSVLDVTADPIDPSTIVTDETSGWGPTDDGRIKPDLVANGTTLTTPTYDKDDPVNTDTDTVSGTSYAAPVVTGSIGLLSQLYQQTYGAALRADLVKSVLAHTAIDAGTPGPDFQFGWGLLNARRAADVIAGAYDGVGEHLIEGVFRPGMETRYIATVTSPGELKLTLSWLDPVPASLPDAHTIDDDTRVLVNDLDVQIRAVSPAGTTIYRPWVLARDRSDTNDPALGARPALPGERNTVDNIEQIVVPSAAPGTYEIVITSPRNNGNPQKFAMVVTGAEELGVVAHTGDVTEIDLAQFVKGTDYTITSIDLVNKNELVSRLPVTDSIEELRVNGEAIGHLIDSKQVEQSDTDSTQHTGRLYLAPTTTQVLPDGDLSSIGFQGTLRLHYDVTVGGVVQHRTALIEISPGFGNFVWSGMPSLDDLQHIQRLAYFQFPAGSGGVVPDVTQLGKPPAEAAARLFESVIDTTGTKLPGDASGALDPATRSWLNSPGAPRWVELVDPDPQEPGEFSISALQGAFDILPGKDSGTGQRTGLTEQPERFGVSWLVDTLLAVANQRHADGLPPLLINGISTDDGTGSSSLRTSGDPGRLHEAGMEVDFHSPSVDDIPAFIVQLRDAGLEHGGIVLKEVVHPDPTIVAQINSALGETIATTSGSHTNVLHVGFAAAVPPPEDLNQPINPGDSSSVKDMFLASADALSTLGESLSNSSLLTAGLPMFTAPGAVTPTTIASLLPLGTIFETEIQQVVQSYFAGDADPTLSELVAFLKATGHFSDPVDGSGSPLDPITDTPQRQQVTLRFATTRNTTVPLNLGASLVGSGVTFDPPPTVTVKAGVEFQLTLSADLTSTTGLQDAAQLGIDGFRITLSDADSDPAVATPLAMSGRVGFLKTQVDDGSFSLFSEIAGVFHGGTPGLMSLGAVQASALSDVLALTRPGPDTLQVTLPIEAAPGFSTPPAASMVTAQSDDVTADATVNIALSPAMQGFAQLSSTNVVGAFKTLAAWFDALEQSPLVDVPLPFLERQGIFDGLNAQALLESQLIGALETETVMSNGDGPPTTVLVPTFDDALGLVQQANAGKSSPVVVAADFTTTYPGFEGTPLLVYSIALHEIVAPTDSPASLQELDEAGGGLANLTVDGSSTPAVEVSPEYDLKFNVLVRLTPLGDGIPVETSTTLDTIARRMNPLKSWSGDSNGVVSADGLPDLRVRLRSGFEFNLNFDALTGTDNLQDVLNLLNNAAPGLFSASLVDKQLVLRDHTSGTNQFGVQGANGSFGGLVLGLFGSDDNDDGLIVGSPLYWKTINDQVYVDSASSEPILASSVEYSLADVQATAQFGGLAEIAITGGEGIVSADFALSLRDLDPAQPGNSLTELLAEQTRLASGSSNIVDFATPIASASLLLPIGVTTSGPGGFDLSSLMLPNPVLTVNWPSMYQQVGSSFELDPSTLTLTPFGLDEFATLEGLLPQHITDLLASAASFVSQVFDVGIFHDTFPLINKSVDQLIDFADRFAALATADPITALAMQTGVRLDTLEAQLKDALDEAFGISFGSASGGSGEGEETSPFSGLQLSIIDEPDEAPVLRLDLPFNKELFSAQIPLNLDIPGIPTDLFQFGTTGSLAVTGGVSMNLALGIDLETYTPFLFDDATHVTANLNVDGQDLTFEAGLGPLGVFIGNASQPGRVALDEDGLLVSSGDADGVGESTNPATIAVVLQDNNGDNRHYFDEFIPDDFDLQTHAALGVELPVFFPLEDQPLDATKPSLILEITDLSDPENTTHTTVPDITQIDFSQALDALLGGLDDLFRMLQEALDNGLFGKDLPLIGDKLRDASGFIDKLRQDLIDNLTSDLGGGSGEGESRVRDVSFIQQAVFDAIGPGGLNWLQDQYSANGDLEPDGSITVHDVRVLADGDDVTNDLSLITGDTDTLLFDMKIGMEFFSVQEPFDLDLGIPALGLDVEGQLDVTVGFTYDFNFGISKDAGPFFDVADQDELKVFFDVDIVNLNASAGLLLLEMDISGMSESELDKDARGNHHPEIFHELERSTLNAGQPNEKKVINAFSGEFTVDLVDPNADGQLVITELGSALSLIDVEVSALATVHLNMLATLGGDTNFPSLAGELHLYWDFDTLDEFSDSTPTIEFRDIRLNVGELFTDLFGSALREVQNTAQQVQPILDVLTDPIPVISDLAGSPVALVDLAELFGVAEVKDFITVADAIVDLLANLPTGLSGELFILYGGFTFEDGSITKDVYADNFDLGDRLKEVDPELTDFYNSTQGVIQGSGGSGEGESGVDDVFSFPILEDPLNVFQLLTGKTDIELVRIDIPKFALDFSYTQKFPVFGPVFARVTGSLGFSFDTLLGYDTQGFFDYKESGFTRPASLFNGFYIWDVDPNTKREISEVELHGGFEVGAEFNAGLASAGAKGGISLRINFDLNDPNDDGKVRFNELVDNAAPGPIWIFDIGGKVEAGASVYVKLGVCPICTEFDRKIATVTLLDFDTPRPDPIVIPEATLGRVESGELIVHVGPEAPRRRDSDPDNEFGIDISDGDDNVYVRPGQRPDEVVVSAFGIQQRFTGVTSIRIEGGAGNDQITIDSGVSQPVEIYGDFDPDAHPSEAGTGGDDILVAGGGAAKLYGGPGDDRLTGGNSDDELYGGDGNDVLLGKDGDDLLDGGAGNDTLDGSFGDDELLGGDGDDTIHGGPGDDTADGGAGNDILFGGDGNDRLIGGDGNDRLYGEQGQDQLWGDDPDDPSATGADTLDGGDNNDELMAGPGNDIANGGRGNDIIFGNEGNDVLTGGPGSDQMHGGDGNDTMYAGTGANPNDQTGEPGAFHLMTGGDGDDVMHGDFGRDFMDLGEGNNRAWSYLGNDEILSGSGNDFVDSGPNDDTINIAGGNNTVLAGFGNDIVVTGDGDDFIDVRGSASIPEQTHHTITSGDGNDIIFGDNGDDTIDSGGGDDSITTFAGNDNIVAGAGNDSIDSGPGDDHVVAGLGDDTVVAGPGNDEVIGGDGDDSIDGGAGNDVLHGNAGDDTILGNDGDDLIVGHDGNDDLSGNAGFDVIWGGSEVFARSNFNVSNTSLFTFPPGYFDAEALNPSGYIPPLITPIVVSGLSIDGAFDDGRDILRGGPDRDYLFGGGLDDKLYGEGGDDYLDGGAGPDLVDGGPGDDVVRGGANDDKLFGGPGIDQLYGDSGNDLLRGDAGITVRPDDPHPRFGPDCADVALATTAVHVLCGQRMFGGDGSDTLFAYAHPDDPISGIELRGDEMHGGAGNDYLFGNIRQDIMFGGRGNDFLHGEYLLGPDYGLNARADTSGAADRLYGDSGEDEIHGGGGSDFLFGGADSDLLEGQDGRDHIYGGAGIDLIKLDVSSDYQQLGDVIDGHFGNQTKGDVKDDGATDILKIVGTPLPDSIFLSENDVGITSSASLPLNGQLSGVASFRLFIRDAELGDQPVNDVTLDVQVDSTGNTLLDHLVDDINQALQQAISDYNTNNDPSDVDLPVGAVRAVRVGDSLRIETHGLGRDALLQIDEAVSKTNDVLTEELHFTPLQRGVPLLDVEYNAAEEVGVQSGPLSPTLLSNGQLSGDASFSITIDGDVAAQVVVNASATSGNASFDDLIADLNAALASALIEGAYPHAPDVITAVPRGDRFVLQTNGLGRQTDLRIQNLSGTAATELMLVEGAVGTPVGGPEPIRVNWRDADGKPLVEQFRIAGLGGNDEIGFVQGKHAVGMEDLSLRSSDWVGVIDGGSGDDILYGSGAIDRLDGGRGSDLIYGFGGNDRLWGDTANGSPNDLDVLFAGGGNDDLIGGQGRNRLYAWSFNPYGPLHFDDGQRAVEVDGKLTLDAVSRMPSNGRLPRDARFALQIDGTDFVPLFLPADQTKHNTSVEDLVEQLQQVVDTEPDLVGKVTISHVKGKLRIQTTSSQLEIKTDQFGVFVGEAGLLVDNNGDLLDGDGAPNPDGLLDADQTSLPYPQEDTGLNRMLGSPLDDRLYGGTGLDFLYGNGGDDLLYTHDGELFEVGFGVPAGDEWKAYARATNKVWYYGATGADDVISVDYVTEPGLLADHHLITRLTNNNGNFTFDAQVRLDFLATDSEGNRIWDPTDRNIDVDRLESSDPDERELAYQEIALNGNILPPEGDFLAIIIDALGGNDVVNVGPTVQKTVWIDGGPGDDRIVIRSGNAILPDMTEAPSRNEVLGAANDPQRAFSLYGPSMLLATAPGPADGRIGDATSLWLELSLNGATPVPVSVPVENTATNTTFADLVADIQASIDATSLAGMVQAVDVDGRLALVPTDVGAGTRLEVTDANAAAQSLLHVAIGSASAGTTIAGSVEFTGLTIDNPADVDWYQFTLLQDTGVSDRLNVRSESVRDRLKVRLYRRDEQGHLVSIGETNPDALGPVPDRSERSLVGPHLAPADGRLASTVHFALEVSRPAGDQTINVSLPASTTAENATLAALARQLEEHIRSSAGKIVGGMLSVHEERGRLVIESAANSDITSMSVEFADQASADQLGFELQQQTGTPSNAFPLGSLEDLGVLTGATSSGQADVDEYRVTLSDVLPASAGPLLLRVDPAASAQLEIQLLDDVGTVLQSAVAGGSLPSAVAALDLSGLSAGDYRIRVVHVDPDPWAAARYQLDAQLIAGGTTSIDLSGGAQDELSLSGLKAGETYYVSVHSMNQIPTIYALALDLGSAETVTVNLSAATTVDRRDVLIGGEGHDVLWGGSAPDWAFGGPGNDVLSGGFDRQQSDLLFGGEGDDLFQVVTDDLPINEQTGEPVLPTLTDRFDGGEGYDRVLFLGGDLDRLGRPVPDHVAIRFNRFLQRYEFTTLQWDIANQQFIHAPTDIRATITGTAPAGRDPDAFDFNLSSDATFDLCVGDAQTETNACGSGGTLTTITVPADGDNHSLQDLRADLSAAIKAAGLDSAVVVEVEGRALRLATTEFGANAALKILNPNSVAESELHFGHGQAAVGLADSFAQQFAFYQTHDVEGTVIDTRAGDDVVHADPEYQFPLADGSGFLDSEWGIKPGNFQEGATIGALVIRGGDGNDQLFGGALADVIEGGAGFDYAAGSEGDDTIDGGSGLDVLQGNSGIVPDRFEVVTRDSQPGFNDGANFAALLRPIHAGDRIGNLSFSLADAGDWYLIPTPEAQQRFGDVQTAALTADMFSVSFDSPRVQEFFQPPELFTVTPSASILFALNSASIPTEVADAFSGNGIPLDPLATVEVSEASRHWYVHNLNRDYVIVLDDVLRVSERRWDGRNVYLFATTENDPNSELSLIPVEQAAGVPEYYALHVVNPLSYTVRGVADVKIESVLPDVAPATAWFSVIVDGVPSSGIGVELTDDQGTALPIDTVFDNLSKAVLEGTNSAVFAVQDQTHFMLALRKPGSLKIELHNEEARQLGFEDGQDNQGPVDGLGTYAIDIAPSLGQVIDVPATAGDLIVESAFTADRPALIPLGDIDGLGTGDFIATVEDNAGTLADLQQPYDKMVTNPHELIGPSYARIVLAESASDKVKIDASNSITLRLPAPVLGDSFGVRTIFASPGDYNQDGRSDIAAIVASNTPTFLGPEHPAAGLYVLYGRSSWPAEVDLVNDADVIIAGFNSLQSIDNVGDVIGTDGVDDIAVGELQNALDPSVFVFEGGAAKPAWQNSGTYYFADFESDDGGFVIDNAPVDSSGQRLAPVDGLWHRSTGRSDDPLHSANYSFYFGTGEDSSGGGTYNVGDTAGIITSPVVTIPESVDNLQLSFNNYLLTEGDTLGTFDVAEVQVSINGGAFQRVAANASGSFVELQESREFWRPVRIDLGAVSAGDKVQFRFVFDTVDAVAQLEGWYVDDVRLSAATDASAVSAAQFSGGASLVGQVGDLNNDGSDDLVAIAPPVSPETDSATLYVVHGGAGFPTSGDLSATDPANKIHDVAIDLGLGSIDLSIDAAGGS